MCDASPLGIFLAGASGDCLYVNPAGQRIMGQSARGRAGARVDERPAPRGPRAGRRALGLGGRGAQRLRDARSTASCTRTASPFRRGARRAGHRPDARRELPRHPRGRHRPRCAPSRSGRSCWRAPRRRARRPRQSRAGGGGRARGRRDILSRISDAFIALDSAGRYTYANDRALAMCGHGRASEMIGKVAWEVYPAARRGADAPRVRARGRRAEGDHRRGAVVAGGCTRSRLYPSPTGVSFFFEDIADRRSARKNSSRAIATTCARSWTAWTPGRRSSAARPGFAG